MAEKIYTIPVNEAFAEDCECPLCLLESRFEREMAEYFLGPSLMEPDHRVATNEKGFCGRHLGMLFDSGKNRLGLALILDTHIAARMERFKHLSADSALEKIGGGCALCEKLFYTMDRYYDVVFHLWRTDVDFRRKLTGGKGFCQRHYAALLTASKRYCSKKESASFVADTAPRQLDGLGRAREGLRAFIGTFDYRAAGESPPDAAKDALPMAIEKLSGIKK
jgi:hypothetical protein